MIIEVTGRLVINYRARERINGRLAWCELPYPGHPKGCPNFKGSCQTFPRIHEYFDLEKPHWFCIQEFNIADHAAKMKAAHPDWSDRMCRNVLYWQNGVRAQLHRECSKFLLDVTTITAQWTTIPEMMGVNVILTMRRLGLEIELKPVHIVRKVALIAWRKKDVRWKPLR